MYIFEAHYTNMDSNEEITRKIEFDGQFMENDKECYMFAMHNAYEFKEKMSVYAWLNLLRVKKPKRAATKYIEWGEII